MSRTLIADTAKQTDQTVTVKGWVDRVRNHKGIIFWDVRDFTGRLQVVLSAETKDFSGAGEVKEEYVVTVEGKVAQRPEKMVNPDLETGKIELQAVSFSIINRSAVPPFVLTETAEVNEELRLKYRYLDLRTERMAKNLTLRHEVNQFIRQYLTKEGFREVETPILSKSTPEGARDFLVPARKYPGKFYALPQSPQQYKQLLMIAGIERYFQIATCFRDEDQRGERLPEFTQLDIEMSFVEQEDVLTLVEKLMIELISTVTPEKKILKTPFPRLTYKEALAKHGTDKPDLRTDKNDPHQLAFCWVTDFPMFEYKKGDKRWATQHNPFTMPKADGHQTIFDVAAGKKPVEALEPIGAEQYDLALNGHEIFGGAVRNHDPKLLSAVFEAIGYQKEAVEEQFGHLLEAFTFGVPPHAGIASGQDRLIMLLANEPTIREVIAFPKNGEAYDPLMDSPAAVSPEQLKELGISLSGKK